ncbi:MAG: hypothetical protein P1U34_03150 [Coxiellaceae bacterium]|nr:hypothetical protein [Coxiellaceae bacterium]
MRTPSSGTGNVTPNNETGTTIHLADWYDLVLGENARINIESNYRVGYWAKRIWAERDRHSGHAMRLVFATGAGLGIGALQTIHTVCSNTSNIFGDAWNYWDSAYGVIAASVDLPALKREQNQPKSDAKNARVFFAKLDCVASVNLTATTIVSQLVAAHAVAAMWAPAGAFGFAACMWASFAHACYDLHRARKKTDPVYLLFDRIKKYKAINEQLQSFTTEEQKATPEYKAVIDNKTRLKLQIDALYHTHIDQINEAIAGSNGINASNLLTAKEKNTIFHELRSLGKPLANNNDRFTNFIREKHITPANAAVYRVTTQRLLNKQKNKVKKRAWYASTWGLAAIGMTMIAFASICPPLAVAGAIIAAAAGVSKLVEIAEDYNLHKKLFTSNGKKFKAELAKDHHTDTDSRITQIHELFKEKNPAIKISDIKTLYITELKGQPERRKKLYRRAHQRFTENRLIRKQLQGELNENFEQQGLARPNTQDINECVEQAFSALSEHDRESVIERALNHKAPKPIDAQTPATSMPLATHSRR